MLDRRASGQRLYRNMLVFLASGPEASRRTRARVGRVSRLEGDRRSTEENSTWTCSKRTRRSRRGPTLIARSTFALPRRINGVSFRHQPDPTGRSRMGDDQGRRTRAPRGSHEPQTCQRRISGSRTQPSFLRPPSYGRRALADVGRRPHYRERALGRVCTIPVFATAEDPWRCLAPRLDRERNPFLADHGFALADAFDPDTGRFVGLTTNGDGAIVIGTTLVVDPAVATAQLAQLAPASTEYVPQDRSTTGGRGW